MSWLCYWIFLTKQGKPIQWNHKVYNNDFFFSPNQHELSFSARNQLMITWNFHIILRYDVRKYKSFDKIRKRRRLFVSQLSSLFCSIVLSPSQASMYSFLIWSSIWGERKKERTYREKAREDQVVVLSELSHGGALSSGDDKGSYVVKLLGLPYLHAFDPQPSQRCHNK